MVQSGLADRTEVSPIRLAVHLSLAFLILGWIVWLILDGRHPASKIRQSAPSSRGEILFWNRRVLIEIRVFVALAFLLIPAGAFVAGLDGGLVHRDWPLMTGRVIPEDYGVWPANMVSIAAAAQFHHRVLAYGVLLFALWLVWRTRRAESSLRRTNRLVLIAGLGQAALGVAVLYSAVALPVALAHQLGAVFFFISVLIFWREAEKSQPQKPYAKALSEILAGNAQ